MFQKGTYKFNADANFNFQLNRVVMWGGGNPDDRMDRTDEQKEFSIEYIRGRLYSVRGYITDTSGFHSLF